MFTKERKKGKGRNGPNRNRSVGEQVEGFNSVDSFNVGICEEAGWD